MTCIDEFSDQFQLCHPNIKLEHTRSDRNHAYLTYILYHNHLIEYTIDNPTVYDKFHRKSLYTCTDVGVFDRFSSAFLE